MKDLLKMRKTYRVGMLLVLSGLLTFGPLVVNAAEVGLVTSLSGNVTLLGEKGVELALKPFVKVRSGDRLTLTEQARLQLVFFDGGRQETWLGSGVLALAEQSSQILKGDLQSEVKILPAVLVKQLSRTPSSGGNVKAGMLRLRSAPGTEGLESAERSYTEWRAQAAANERSLELYLLASYFESRAFEKLEGLLRQMAARAPNDQEVAALDALYTSAIGELRSAETAARQR